MSKANEKTPTPQTDAPTGGTNLAVVQPAPSATVESNQGCGGLYTMVNGVRQRVAYTKSQFDKKEAK